MWSRASLAVAIGLACASSGGCERSDRLSYTWDDRRILCSDAIDNMKQDAPWNLLEDELSAAHDQSRVALFHAHRPGVTVSLAAIRRVLELADRHHLDYITYDELEPGPARAGLALAFDDNSIEEWLSIRDLLDEHHAHVTFFVTRYARLTDDERAGIAQLAADGHDIEPHSVAHLHAPQYVTDHGLDAYLADEAMPSMQVLAADGYTPTSYAFPFGSHTDALDAALLANIGKIRVSPGECPW